MAKDEEIYKLPPQQEPITLDDVRSLINSMQKFQTGDNVMQSGLKKSQNFVTGSAGWQIDAVGNAEFNAATIRGQLIAGSIDIPDITTASSFHVDTLGNAWWGATTLGASVASVTKAGLGTFSNINITGGTVGSAVVVALGALNIAARGWSQTCTFSITDADTIAWGAGTFTSADGTAYSIGAGNTGNMTLKTYIYLDIAVSTTAYQTTTTASTAVGAGKALVATAQNATGEAIYTVLAGQGGQNIDATSIVANSITANELSTSITYAGSIIIDAAGLIRSGQTAYDTGTGWFIGNVAGTPKLSIGNSAGNKITWDGTTLTIKGRSSTFVTQDIPFIVDASTRTQIFSTSNSDGSVLFVGVVLSSTMTIYRYVSGNDGNYYITHTATAVNWSGGDGGMAIVGSYLYLTYVTSGTVNTMLRFLAADLTGSTTMTVSGIFRFGASWSDGTDLYIVNAVNFDKFTISGTTATNASTVAFTSLNAAQGAISNGVNVWVYDGSNVHKYVIAGGAIISTTAFAPLYNAYDGGIAPKIFLGNASSLGFAWLYTTFGRASGGANPTVASWLHLVSVALP